MKLKVLGSSSNGNCYLLDNGDEVLVIECGMPFIEVQKAVGFDIKRIVGAIVTHEHGDHAKYIGKFHEYCIPTYLSRGTAEALGVQNHSFCRIVAPMERFNVGSFKVMPFPTQHDAAEPFGFLINHKETGTILFATDTYYLKYKFKGLNNILIECNYRKDILDENVANGRVSIAQRNRVLQSHLSYKNCLDTLLENDLSNVNNIVLIHLSNGNSNAYEFRKGIEDNTCVKVHVAERGMEILFNKTLF